MEEKLTDQEVVRRQKVEKLKEMGIDPFGQAFDQTDWSKDIKEKEAGDRSLWISVYVHDGANRRDYHIIYGTGK